MSYKVTYMGKDVQPRFKGRFSTKSKLAGAWGYFYLAFKINVGALVTAAVLIAVGMQAAQTDTVKADNTIVTRVVEVEAKAAILDRIAACESGNGTPGSSRQTANDGQVVIHMNNNGTYDIGRFQINSIHRAQATKLGFDLFTDEGNTAFAKWMWENKGTGDWDSSARCWRK